MNLAETNRELRAIKNELREIKRLMLPPYSRWEQRREPEENSREEEDLLHAELGKLLNPVHKDMAELRYKVSMLPAAIQDIADMQRRISKLEGKL